MPDHAIVPLCNSGSVDEAMQAKRGRWSLQAGSDEGTASPALAQKRTSGGGVDCDFKSFCVERRNRLVKRFVAD